ncbi:YfjI family protein [Pseudophaeobacter sp. A-200-2]|uniref:YfjI family protein n=1 Tax=Pseudophaeobacter sp. A-200-2 TaxID=3098145 RepID=UPI0034D4464F
MDIGLGNIDWDAVDEHLVGVGAELSQDTANTPQAAAVSPTLASFTAAPAGNGPSAFDIEAEKATEPDEVYRKAMPALEFPCEALGPLKDVVMAVADQTQAPVAIAAGSALSIASLAVQGHGDVELLHGTAPTSLFVLTIARSGERKSTVDKMLAQAVEKHEREQERAYREAMKKYRIATEARKQQENGARSSIRSGEAGTEALEELGDAPCAPLLPDRVITEPTFEGLTKLYEAGNPSLGLLSDEGGQFLGGHAMNRDNAQKTLTAFSKLWDGAAIKRTRAGDGTSTLRDRRLSMHLMVQPVIAQGLVSDPLAVGQGFLPRMLLCEPASNIGKRRVHIGQKAPEAESWQKQAIARWEQRIKGALDAVMPAWGDHAKTQGQNLKPNRLRLSGDARLALGEFAQKVEHAQAPGGPLADVTGAASKIAEQACRIAGVLTLVDDLNARMVAPETMHDAIIIAGFYMAEALRLTGAAVISQKEQETEALRKWMLESWPETAERNGMDREYLTPRDVVTYGPNCLRSAAKVKEVMSELAKLGWLTKLEPGSEVNGSKPRLAYRITGPN